MILIDNINILKESYRGAYEILQAYENSEEDIKFTHEVADEAFRVVKKRHPELEEKGGYYATK